MIAAPPFCPEAQMFHDIPTEMLERMRELERRDEIDRADGTPRLQRLRQIPPDTGRFLALWAASAPEGALIEIGTSAGYSALWLSLACRAAGRTLTTFEVLPEKATVARETFSQAAVEDVVQLVEGDFLDHAEEIDRVGSASWTPRRRPTRHAGRSSCRASFPAAC
jgi:caffeoyl-CoA O-methyltransferase